MKLRTVPSSWFEKEGRRLDCGPYLSGAIEAKVLLERLPVRKAPLREVTRGGMAGIYHAGREARNYVDDSAHGVPFLRSASILSADLSWLPLISKKQVEQTPGFIIREGWTLITRSGTVGRMAYVRPEMDGLACSEDVLRVVPDPDKILPGYLYAYLSSRFGVPLVVAGTYGAIIQHIEPTHIADLPVPLLSHNDQAQIHELIAKSGNARAEASLLLQEAQKTLLSALGPLPRLGHQGSYGNTVSVLRLSQNLRFDAYFHNPIARAIEDWITSLPDGHATLGELTEAIFDVPPFKHIYVDPHHGVPFFTSGDIFQLDRKTEKYLSKTKTKGLEKYILRQGWILLARSGQLGGIVGRPQYADSALHSAAASDHVIRIKAKLDVSTPGFLYTYLSLPAVGYPLVTRTMTGSSIPALWPASLALMKIPLIGTDVQLRLDETVSRAFELRVTASAWERQAREHIESLIEQDDRE